MDDRPLWSRRSTRFAVTVAIATGLVACSPPADIESDSSASPVTPAPTQPIADANAGTPTAPDATVSQTANGLDGVTVAVIGDSLTVSARAQIEDAFTAADADVVGFDALDGRRMVYGTPERPGGLAAVEAITVEPDVWVIALGTNDVGAQADPDELENDVSAILDAVDAPVVWIDVFLGAYTPQSAEFGELLRDEAAARPTVTVGDWFHEALDLDLLVDDQVHLTDTGKQRFADLMVETVGRSDGA